MGYVPAQTVEVAKTQVGFHEGRSNWNPYSQWQYGNPNNPWCASFQSWCQYAAGYRFNGDGTHCTYGDKGEAYTPTQKIRAQEHGHWRDKNWRAQPGDAVLFDWYNDGLIDHVEIVVFDNGTIIITIGGNTSDAVMFRTRDRKYVAGFWAISQSPQAKPVLTAADLAAIKRIVRWGREVNSHGGLQFGDNKPNVGITKQIMSKKGWFVLSSRANLNHFGDGLRTAVHEAKKQANIEQPGTFQDTKGGHIGSDFVKWLLDAA